MGEYSHRFNDLSYDERQKLIPYLIESQILHVKNCKFKALVAHRKLMDDYDKHINSMKEDLEAYS